MSDLLRPDERDRERTVGMREARSTPQAMRSARQIGSTVEEWHELQRTERAQTLAALLSELRRARETGAEWHRWITDGRPTLTEAQYAALDSKRTKRRA